MTKEVMKRKASDNEYFHQDFHGALSGGIEYLDEAFGENSVREYLRKFTLSFYRPLIEEFKKGGLPVLKKHFESLYRQERGDAEITLSPDELLIRVRECPAVAHMKKRGYRVARLFHETTRTVNEALCEETPFKAELLEYDPDTGKSLVRFARKP